MPSKPAIGVFVLALWTSMIVHVQGYMGLGVLERFQAAISGQAEKPSDPVELDIDFETASDDPAPDPQEDPRPPADRSAAPPELPPKPKRPKTKVVPPAVAVPTPPKPRNRTNRQAVQQRSQDPTVEPPPDSRFVADENQRVEEETVARLRNLQRDDVVAQAGRSESSRESEGGNADSEDLADARDRRGSEERTATEDEAQREKPDEVPPEARRPALARGDGRPRGEAGPTAEDHQESRAAQNLAALLRLDDGPGSLRVTGRDRGPDEADPTGDTSDRASEPRRPRGRSRQPADRPRSGARPGQGQGPNLRLSWSQFESIYSDAQLRQERERWMKERKSRLRGSNPNRQWREFRAAIENFVPNVRPGNQTALNAAASPFANYIAAVHRRVHREFAFRFLRSLPAGGTSPYADRDLMTELEIILNRDGSVHRIGVIKTSGFLPYDYGAFRAVMRGQPYPQPPDSILSGDGRVYLHWGFYRNERQCGTFNAEPYILPHPPGVPARRPGPFQDRPERGGVVPQGAQPTWGTEGERPADPHDHEHPHPHPEGSEKESEPSSPREPPREAPPRPRPSSPVRARGSALG